MAMNVLSLPASIQQELAARALRACMAAEAAMASLRAECKPLQTASPQRVLALNTKNMANAHRSLQLQIEACESFSLSATTAFKQLCDVIFCGDFGKSVDLEHKSMLHENTHQLKSFKAQVNDLAASIDGELPVCGSWKSRTNAGDESFERSKDDGEGTSVSATAIRDHLAGVRITEAQDTLCWEPENGAAYTRCPSPETENEATSREETVEHISIEEADWNRQLDSQHVQDREDPLQSGNHILMSNIQEDSDTSDLDVDLSSEISSLRENSILSINSSENSLDDGFKLHKTITKSSSITAENERSTGAVEHAGSCVQIHQPTTSENLELNSTNLRDFEHEHRATQSTKIHFNGSTKTSRLAGSADSAPFQKTLDREFPPCASDSHSGVSSHTATGSPPPPSSSSNEVPKRCNSYGASELELAAPSFSTPLHESWTAAEVTRTQTPSSNASQISWSCESSRSVETPSKTQPLSLLECNPRVSYASVERWDPSKTSSNLPLYTAHWQSPEPIGMIPAPAASASVRGFHQEHKPAVLSFESQDLAVLHKLQPLFNRETGHSPPCLSHTDETHCAEPNVPLTPSPYTLKTRSMFSRANLARKPSSGNSIPAPLKSSIAHSDGHLFSMATAASLSSGYRQPSINSGMPSGSSGCVSVKEKQTLQIVSETPLLTQFSVSPISSSISTSSLSRESPILSNISRSDGSGREGSFNNYKKTLENLQEQFPRAHGSFTVEPLSSTRNGILVSNPVGNNSLQNTCETPWQTSLMRTTTETEVERHVGAASGSRSTSEAKHVSGQARPIGERGGYTQESVSDRSVECNGSKAGSLESDSRYDGIMQGSKISDIQVSEVGICVTSNSESCDMTSRELNRIDSSAQKSHSRQETTSWSWNHHNQSDNETAVTLGVPVSSRGRASNSVVMVPGSAGDCARRESIVRLREVCDSEDDDDDSSTEREWNDILVSMQERGKP